MRFMHHSRSKLRAVLLTGLSLAACTVGQRASAQGGTGGRAADPAPVSAVLDSASLAQALQAATPPAVDGARPSVFLVHFAPAGTVDSVRWTLRTERPADAGAIEQTVARHARPQAPRAGPWAYYVRTVGGSARPVEIRKVTERAPQLVNASRIVRDINQFVKQVREANPGYPRGDRSVLVRGVVSREGKMEPVSVSVVHGSGDPGVDQEAVRLARLTRYKPAIVLEMPVPVLVTFPITFNF
jgi:TonB family protein